MVKLDRGEVAVIHSVSRTVPPQSIFTGNAVYARHRQRIYQTEDCWRILLTPVMTWTMRHFRVQLQSSSQRRKSALSELVVHLGATHKIPDRDTGQKS